MAQMNLKKPSQNNVTRSLLPFFLLSAILVLLDQISKLTIEAHFAFQEFIPVTSFFNIGLVYNPGAAFSFLANHNGWQRWFFTILSIAASIFIITQMRQYRQKTAYCIGLALILSGAIGNLIDRIRIGKVVDFLDFHLMGYHWPVFNIADSAIFIGVAILLFDEFRKKSS